MRVQGNASLLVLIAAHVLTLSPAAGAEPVTHDDEHLSIPIRWCAVRGTPAVEHASGTERPAIDEVLRARHTRATVFVWMPQSGISFRSALTTEMQAEAGFPIINDPRPSTDKDSAGPGLEGDILAPSYDKEDLHELNAVIAECEKAWEDLEDQFETNVEGIIGIHIRRFVKPDGSPSDLLGIGTSIHAVLHGTDKCEVPPDLNDYSPLVSNDGWVVVVDDHFISDSDPQDSTLAHELGHVLFLGHGNGEDDPVGNPPRKNERYDAFCDDQEDVHAAPTTLMKPTSPVPGQLTELQRASARAVARVTVGGIVVKTDGLQHGSILSDDEVDTVGEVKDPSVDLRSLGIQYHTLKGVTILSYRLAGRLPQRPNHRFLFFADLDADPKTGGTPSVLGFQTGFKGAEFVAEVLVKGREGETESRITPAICEYRSGKFTKRPPDPRIKADVHPAVSGHTDKAVHDAVSIQLPQGLVKPGLVKVRFQAVAERVGKAFDRLPDEADYGRLLRLTRPIYPLCRAIPDTAKPGSSIRIQATGFIPNRTAKILFNQKLMGKGSMNDEGNLTVPLRIPQEAKDGLHLLVIAEEDKAMTAQCALRVTKEHVENITPAGISR